MSITHIDAIRNAIADVVVDSIDAGSGPGELVLMTAGNLTVATLTFSATAFGSASNGMATANDITADENAVGGTVTKFKVTDSNGVSKFLGTVGVTGSGADIELTNVVIGAGDKVAVSLLTYSAPL